MPFWCWLNTWEVNVHEHLLWSWNVTILRETLAIFQNSYSSTEFRFRRLTCLIYFVCLNMYWVQLSTQILKFYSSHIKFFYCVRNQWAASNTYQYCFMFPLEDILFKVVTCVSGLLIRHGVHFVRVLFSASAIIPQFMFMLMVQLCVDFKKAILIS